MEAVVFFALLYLAYRLTHWRTEAEASPAPAAVAPQDVPRIPRAARVPHANMRPMRKTRSDVDPCVECTTGDCDGCPDNPEDD